MQCNGGQAGADELYVRPWKRHTDNETLATSHNAAITVHAWTRDRTTIPEPKRQIWWGTGEIVPTASSVPTAADTHTTDPGRSCIICCADCGHTQQMHGPYMHGRQPELTSAARRIQDRSDAPQHLVYTHETGPCRYQLRTWASGPYNNNCCSNHPHPPATNRIAGYR